jgi:RimJ/RimL family protein N-acetyltransferase
MVEPVELRTARLLLRPWRLNDAGFAYERVQDPEFGRFILASLPNPYLFGHAEQFVANAVLRDWANEPSFVFELDGRAIGDVSVRVDAQHAIAEMGWGVAREHWGKGLMTEAAGAAMRWAFDTYDLARVYARCDAENVGSWRVMEKLGMRREAHLRGHRLLRGERRDELWYGILRSELGAE